MMQIEESQNEEANQENGRLQNERMMEYLRLEKEREAALRNGKPLENISAEPPSRKVKMDFSSYGTQKEKGNSLLHHVLHVVQSSSEILGVERDSWRFRITPDPRFLMDELKGSAFHSFYFDSTRTLRNLLMDLRDEHHFVVPHNGRLQGMDGCYLVMFSINQPDHRL